MSQFKETMEHFEFMEYNFKGAKLVFGELEKEYNRNKRKLENYEMRIQDKHFYDFEEVTVDFFKIFQIKLLMYGKYVFRHKENDIFKQELEAFYNLPRRISQSDNDKFNRKFNVLRDDITAFMDQINEKKNERFVEAMTFLDKRWVLCQGARIEFMLFKIQGDTFHTKRNDFLRLCNLLIYELKTYIARKNHYETQTHTMRHLDIEDITECYCKRLHMILNIMLILYPFILDIDKFSQSEEYKGADLQVDLNQTLSTRHVYASKYQTIALEEQFFFSSDKIFSFLEEEINKFLVGMVNSRRKKEEAEKAKFLEKKRAFEEKNRMLAEQRQTDLLDQENPGFIDQHVEGLRSHNSSPQFGFNLKSSDTFGHAAQSQAQSQQANVLLQDDFGQQRPQFVRQESYREDTLEAAEGGGAYGLVAAEAPSKRSINNAISADRSGFIIQQFSKMTLDCEASATLEAEYVIAEMNYHQLDHKSRAEAQENINRLKKIHDQGVAEDIKRKNNLLCSATTDDQRLYIESLITQQNINYQYLVQDKIKELSQKK